MIRELYPHGSLDGVGKNRKIRKSVMTKHKKGAEHWTADCAKCKSELERYKKLLREVHDMLGDYYANTSEIQHKIKQELK